MDSEREVIRCFSCLLNQFMPKDKHCRKCKVNLVVDAAMSPEPKELVAETRSFYGNPSIRMDLAVFVLRHRLNLSQRQLALRLNKPRTYVSKVEGGHAQPILVSVCQFAEALEVTPWQLIDMATVAA